MSATAFFTAEEDGWFEPTEHTRGPWHPQHCHAGPPAGLLARSLEQAVAIQFESTDSADNRAAAATAPRLTRMTVNLLRPIPFARLRTAASITHVGRTVSYASASIIDSQERVCAQAEGLFIKPQQQYAFPTHTETVEPLQNAIAGPFPITPQAHDLPAFHHGAQVRYPRGEDGTPGPTTVWMKTVPLLDNEPVSPFQRICPLADCGNAIGRNAEPDDVLFVNADLTITLHREPDGDWLGSRSAGYWESDGIGLADAQLFDQSGVVGRALQNLILRPAS